MAGASDSQSDTEVLPLLYLKYGDRMVEHLNGIFAFAIWDSGQQKLLVARDRMGVKPLYYARVGSRLYFASEVKVPAARPGTASRRLIQRRFLSFCRCCMCRTPERCSENILKLAPGCRLTWQEGKISDRSLLG